MIGNNFPAEHVIGFYNVGHVLIALLYIFGIVSLAIFERRHTRKHIENVILACGIYLIITEIIKIIVAYINVGTISAMFPLPYCGIFLPAIILAMTKNPFLKKVGYTFMAVGGIVGGILYIISPGDSINSYPIYHVKSIHGLSYHFIMAYLGLTLLTTGMVKLKKRDFFYYFGFYCVFAVLGIINNVFFGASSLFLNTGAGIEPLELLVKEFPIFYAIAMFSAQAFLAYFGIFYIYRFIKSHFRLKKASVVLLQEEEIEPESV